jgi:hypothetical protein
MGLVVHAEGRACYLVVGVSEVGVGIIQKLEVCLGIGCSNV